MDRQRGAFATIVRRSKADAISRELAENLLAGYRQLFLHTAGGRDWLESRRASLSEIELEALEG